MEGTYFDDGLVNAEEELVLDELVLDVLDGLDAKERGLSTAVEEHLRPTSRKGLSPSVAPEQPAHQLEVDTAHGPDVEEPRDGASLHVALGRAVVGRLRQAPVGQIGPALGGLEVADTQVADDEDAQPVVGRWEP